MTKQNIREGARPNLGTAALCRRRVLVYRETLGGYAIVCKNCGEVYGSAESADPKFLAGFNRNSRAQKARRPRARRR